MLQSAAEVPRSCESPWRELDSARAGLASISRGLAMPRYTLERKRCAVSPPAAERRLGQADAREVEQKSLQPDGGRVDV